MKNPAKGFCALSLIMASTIVEGQIPGILGDTNPPPNGLYQKDTITRDVPLAFLRQADVMWAQRIWRVIDLREKQNLSFYYPITPTLDRKSLWEIITKALKSGQLAAYEDNTIVDPDNTFDVRLTKDKIEQIIEPVDSGEVDDNGNPVPPLPNPITADKIRGYMLKEDWFFDKQRSLMDVRIIGIAPIAVSINKNTKTEDTSGTISPLFWIYFPQIRPILVRYEAFNTHNQAQRNTFDAVFWKRQFSSYIFMESNVYNRLLQSYSIGIDRLLEGEKIKKKMFDIEQDMWQY